MGAELGLIGGKDYLLRRAKPWQGSDFADLDAAEAQISNYEEMHTHP